ncbi:MAG: alpha/beta fold hydrolase [Actinobacteria bacterium]|nr:alpha/beta fold hydrolase [Actinomycetota bacterium]
MTGAKPIEGFEERFLDAKAVRMRYFVGGEGPPIVLVHGLAGAAWNWSELAPLLAERRRVLLPDLPGHGGSSPLPAAASLDPYAERVRLVAAAEGMLPAPIVGHSLGGLVALRLALRSPENVEALVLAAAAGIASATRRAEFWLTVFGFLRPARRISPHHERIARSPALARAVFGYWEVSDPASLSPRSVAGFLAGQRLHSDVRSAGRVLVRDDPRLDLERVSCPSLVLWGARDRQVPVEDAFEYTRRLRATLRVIPDCGHLLIAERAAACADAIESFLVGSDPGVFDPET